MKINAAGLTNLFDGRYAVDRLMDRGFLPMGELYAPEWEMLHDATDEEIEACFPEPYWDLGDDQIHQAFVRWYERPMTEEDREAAMEASQRDRDRQRMHRELSPSRN